MHSKETPAEMRDLAYDGAMNGENFKDALVALVNGAMPGHFSPFTGKLDVVAARDAKGANPEAEELRHILTRVYTRLAKLPEAEKIVREEVKKSWMATTLAEKANSKKAVRGQG